MNKTTKYNNLDINKRTQIQFEIRQLLYLVNSRYGALNNVHPTEEEQLEMHKKIANLCEQLKNVC